MSGAPPSWQQLLAQAGIARTDALPLLVRASGRRREWLIAHADEPADPQAALQFVQLAGARRAGRPVAYLLGTREFHGRAFDVGDDVLIPRPETELLVERALAAAPAGARVLDLGTGSGIVAVTLAAERPDLRVLATDRSPAALAVAARNRDRLAPPADGADRVELREGSWWAPIASHETFSVIVSNPPYIAEHDPHLAAGDLRFEPRGALVGGRDGLDDLRTIVAGAPARLDIGGWLMVEHGHDQRAPVQALFRAAGFDAVATFDDLAGLPRVTCGQWSGTRPPRG